MSDIVTTYHASVDCLKDADLYHKAFARLPRTRQDAVNRFAFEKDRRLAVGARILLAFALRQQGLSLSELALTKNEYGKPEFVEGPHFNLSHSGTQVMCVLSDTASVGCDVEGYLDASERLVNYCMQPQEARVILSKTDEAKQLEFCRRWTLKESYMKAYGKGLALHPASFALDFSDTGLRVTGNDTCAFQEFPFDGPYCFSACVLSTGAKFEPMQTVDLARVL